MVNLFFAQMKVVCRLHATINSIVKHKEMKKIVIIFIYYQQMTVLIFYIIS